LTIYDLRLAPISTRFRRIVNRKSQMAAPQKSRGDLTAAQLQAVEARGNVLVMAGAGTGKTKTLVARCLDCLERDGAALDELLIVTFTEAAAAELRERLRRAIEQRAAEIPPAEPPAENFWHEQLARFDFAHIGTLHGFCLKLVREHFYELGLDPRVAILDEGEARQIANETLDEQFAAHYAGDDEFSQSFQDLIHTHGGGRDENIRKLVLRLHNYSQARPDAGGWLAQQREKFSASESSEWPAWLIEAFADWREDWLPVLEGLKSGNVKASELAGILSRLGNGCDSRETAAGILEQIRSADGNWPARQKTVLRKPLGDLFDEAEFLLSLAAVKNGADPLAEDWSWVRRQMETLLCLAEEFAQQLAERKRADGVLDFHDLEQFALKLLWDFSAGRPAAVAESWRKKLKFIFVDEYQDINAAQDKIIQGLSSGTGSLPVRTKETRGQDASAPAGNRFLVGDVKQSIYRFRLADPGIFRDYAKSWRGENGTAISLSENFRSRESLLNFINALFRVSMREEAGGLSYDRNAELKFGSPEAFSAARDSAPRAELLVRFKTGRNENSGEEDDLAGLGDTECEARLVVQRLKKLMAGNTEIFDDKQKTFRPAEWRDVAILLRSPGGRSEVFAKEFERAGIPLDVARGRFYESAEILDLLNLLQLLDNPLQDVPCIAVLRSPLVGFSLDELAEIRLAAKDRHFWTALAGSQKSAAGSQDETAAKASRFLERFSRWRKMVRQFSLSQCLEEILAETLYADWLRAQPRGRQRAAKVATFLNLAQKFDQFQRQGLGRFLKFIEAQQEAEAEPEVPAAAAENAVRLMSIHQSKGLEFPIVVLADLSKNFNEQDLHGEIIFDEEFGLCPKVKPPHAGGRYPSLPHWLARRRQKRELRGEELRLLYVAMTRARDNLILTASVTEKNWNEKWLAPRPATGHAIAGARCFADWVALWFGSRNAECGTGDQNAGVLPELRWRVITDVELSDRSFGSRGSETPLEPANVETGNGFALPDADGRENIEKLRVRLAWEYPFQAATRRKAKSSVTALRREAEELDEEAEPFFPAARKRKAESGERKLSAAEIGAAHHKFLQHVAFNGISNPAAEVERLQSKKYLSADECAVLDLESLTQFWESELGKEIVAHAGAVRRELPFTARLSPAEIRNITGAQTGEGLEDEFVIVQGVADLAVILPEEIWLVDFKTDAVGKNELRQKVKIYTPQLKLYAAALEKIFSRKVSRQALHFLAAGTTVEL
jgi:ATP-dependent helicase/nuclease subunit A